MPKGEINYEGGDLLIRKVFCSLYTGFKCLLITYPLDVCRVRLSL